MKRKNKKTNGDWKQPYYEYLNSTAWKAVKAAYYKDHPKRCSVCGRADKVQLHHTTYEHIFNELDHLDDLKPLCIEHHRAEHGKKPKLVRSPRQDWAILRKKQESKRFTAEITQTEIVKVVPCRACAAPIGEWCVPVKGASMGSGIHKNRTREARKIGFKRIKELAAA